MIKLWSSDGVHAAPPDDQSLHLMSSRTRVIEVAVHKSAWLVYVSKIGYLSWHIFFKLLIRSLFFSIDQQQKSLKDPNSEMMWHRARPFLRNTTKKKGCMFRFSKAIRKRNSVWVFTLRNDPPHRVNNSKGIIPAN